MEYKKVSEVVLPIATLGLTAMQYYIHMLDPDTGPAGILSSSVI